MRDIIYLRKFLSSRLLSKKLKFNTYKTSLLYYRLYFMVVKLGLSRWERSTGYGSSRIKYLGIYLGLREKKLQENWERYIMLSYIYCILRLTLLGILKQDDWDGQDTQHVWSNPEMRTVLVGKPEAKRPLRRPRRRWEDNIKMDLREVGCDPGDWIALAVDRDQWRAYVMMVMNLQVPWKPIS